jgi:hypothetical protein
MRTIDSEEAESLLREERLAYAGPTSLRTRSTEQWLSRVATKCLKDEAPEYT